MKILFGILMFLSFQFAHSQTFTGQLGPIPDNNNLVDFPVSVNGVALPLDTNFGLARICFNISHQNVSDLQMLLVAPSGKAVLMFDGIGWDGNNFTNTCLAGRDRPLIFNGGAPFSGTYSPQQSLGQFNNGELANGVWKLRIRDKRAPTSGQLLFWSITFSNQPARIFPFSSTNLPLILIDTRSQPIPDEPKIPARIRIINNGNGVRNALSDSSQYSWIQMAIEQRGSSSSDFPKKSYGFEFQTQNGEDTSRSVLGMPAQSDWILSANFSDKSLMRNTFAYDLARAMGWYASRSRYVELFLNGEYQGIYVVLEKIKRDANRVDISKLKPSDTTGNNLTGGYIIKIDKATGNDTEGFESSFPPEHYSNGQKIRYFYDYPKAEDLMPAQRKYIKAYVDSFERAAHSVNFATPDGYRKYAYLPSFLDFFILNEWSKNVDGYRLSTYFTKPKITQNGGKLIMGPVWDFDIAWRNANYCNAEFIPGWQYQIEDICPGGYWQPPTWWKILRTDPGFNNELKCRWTEVANNLMPPLKRAEWIDSVKNLLNEAQIRNFQYWPILGEYVWPNPQPILPNFAAEVAGFQNWLNQRASWISANIGGTCQTEIEPAEERQAFAIYPNPAGSKIQFKGIRLDQKLDVAIFNSLGKIQKVADFEDEAMDISALSPGFYWIRIQGLGSVAFLKE